MQPKTKRKRDRLYWRLDFVTALTVDECRQRLESATARLSPDWQRIYLRDDNSFIVERLFTRDLTLYRHENAVEVRFKGTLEQGSTGTRVQGAITEDTHERLMISKWLVILPTIPLLLIGVLALVKGAWGILVAAGIFYGFAAAGVAWEWNQTKWYPVELMGWIRQQLYVPPDQNL